MIVYILQYDDDGLIHDEVYLQEATADAEALKLSRAGFEVTTWECKVSNVDLIKH